MKTLPNVSIIIVNYNGKHFLKNCFTSIAKINNPRNFYEVIMVDNASTDQSVEYVKNQFPWVKILELNMNYGYAGGNNRGVEIALGDLIVFLNNDTVVEKNWLNELVKPIDLDTKIGICGSKIISMRNKDVIQYSGYSLHILGGVIPTSYHLYENKLGKLLKLVGSIQGASFLIKKSVFRELHGFDDDYFVYSEEVDICFRAWIRGYYVVYAPNSIISHFGGGTSDAFNKNQLSFFQNNRLFITSSIFNRRLISPYRILYGNRNSLMNILKNLELRNMVIAIFFSGIYYFIQFLKILQKSDIKRIKLLLSSFLYPIINFKKIWAKRLNIQETRRVRDKELIKMGVLLRITDLLRSIIL